MESHQASSQSLVGFHGAPFSGPVLFSGFIKDEGLDERLKCMSNMLLDDTKLA